MEYKFDFESRERILLVNVFAKNELEELSMGEKNAIKKSLQFLEQDLFGSKKR